MYVRDSGNPFLDQTTTLTICVTDINDNGPIFQGDIAIQISVAENFTVNDEILVVTATDADNIMGDGSCPSEGINSTIHYSLLFVVSGYFLSYIHTQYIHIHAHKIHTNTYMHNTYTYYTCIQNTYKYIRY